MDTELLQRRTNEWLHPGSGPATERTRYRTTDININSFDIYININNINNINNTNNINISNINNIKSDFLERPHTMFFC